MKKTKTQRSEEIEMVEYPFDTFSVYVRKEDQEKFEAYMLSILQSQEKI